MSLRRLLVVLSVGATLLIGLAMSGAVVVGPGEAVVVRRFGRVLAETWGPGLHLGLPRGIDRHERVRLEEVRRIEVGLAGLAGPNDDPGAGEYLTGDLNLLRARAVVQYRVADPAKYVLAANQREEILVRLSEASLTRRLTRTPIDGAIREGRAEVADAIQADLAERLTTYGLGVAVLGVSLTDVQVPIEVQPEFAAAQAAQSDKERKRFEAKSRAETMLIAAKGNARSIEENAHAETKRMLELAKARAGSFLILLAEFERARHLTVKNLYLDAMRDLTPKIRRKILLTPEEPIDISIIGSDRAESR